VTVVHSDQRHPSPNEIPSAHAFNQDLSNALCACSLGILANALAVHYVVQSIS
jgi:hypothetical protein